MEKFALISRCLNTDNYMYICDIPRDNELLYDLYKNLQYLYPFRYSTKDNILFNSEDFRFIATRYGLKLNLKLLGKSVKKVLTFQTPIIYNIQTFTPVFKKPILKPVYRDLTRNNVCIVFPHKDPIERGKMLYELIKYNIKTFIVLGDCLAPDKDSLSTLMTRYLISCRVPIKNIIKLKNDKMPDCLLESLELLNVTEIDTDLKYFITCPKENIQFIAKNIRKMRKTGYLDMRFRYII